MVIACCVLLQVVWSGQVVGEGPVRIGAPLPAEAVARGLRLEASPGARLQWSLLQREPTPTSRHLWVELAMLGAHGRFRVLGGGAGPASDGAGAVCVLHVDEQRDAFGEHRERTWTWADGSVDRLSRTRWLALPPGHGGELAVGEAETHVSADWSERCLRVETSPRLWRGAGVLPPESGLGRALREDLLAVVPLLRGAPGPRGHGDYLRGDGQRPVCTNLEYDTTLGLMRLALAESDRDCAQRALAAARHLVDSDLELRSGLPYRHGAGHRVARPELGHCWLRGLLLVGCVFADHDLIEQALSIGRALAAHCRARERAGDGADDRARDVAWPLFELEALLRFSDEPGLREAADRLAAELCDRFDPQRAVFRFGEGEMAGGCYRERAWLTGGIVLPALDLHVERTGDDRARDCARRAETRLLALLRSGRGGVPIAYLDAGRGPFAEVRVVARAEAHLLLDGLGLGELRRCLERGAVRGALSGALAREHDDLATRFSMIARCEWVLR